MLWFRFCNHYIVACFLWSKNCEHFSSNYGLYCFNSDCCRVPLAEILILSLTCSQAVFMSPLSYKLYKFPNLLEILIWYCFLTSSSFSFLRLNLSTLNFCAFTATRQGSVSQLPWKIVHWVYLNTISCLSIFVIILIVYHPIRRGPGEFMNVLAQEHRALNN